jgi:hypothetical protein
VVRLLLDQAEAGFCVNSAGGVEDAVRNRRPPQNGSTPLPDAGHQEQAELRDFIGLMHQEHATNAVAVSLRDPAGFPLGIEIPVVGRFALLGRPILAAGRLLGGQSRLKAVRAELPAPQNQTDPLPKFRMN